MEPVVHDLHHSCGTHFRITDERNLQANHPEAKNEEARYSGS
jgi:hypothetical protein